MSRRVSPVAYAPPVMRVVACACLLLSPVAARAQSAQSIRETRRLEMETRQRVRWEMEKLKRGGSAKATAKRPAYRDVEEDFEQLQVRNYALAGMFAAPAPFDYAQIKREAVEVKKRAARLKVCLALPAPEAEPAPGKTVAPLTADGLKALVGSLDALVNRFVWNPVFRRPDIIDVGQAAKASRDLADILDASEQIQRYADTLSKKTGQR